MKSIRICLLSIFSVFISTTIFASSHDTLKLLAIGNSFSENSVEFIEKIASSDGKHVIIGNLIIGGCSLERHWNNAVSGAEQYIYDKNVCGDKSRVDGKSLIFGIKDENWDFISVQQVSHLAGVYDTYSPYVGKLLEYVKKNATNNRVQFALHRTWAYPPTSNHSGFALYDRDQIMMFNSIVEATEMVAKEHKIRIIIPSAEAIQNGRESLIGEGFNSDGFHLNKLGRYTAGCAWYETFFKKSVVGNLFIPEGIDPIQVQIAQHAAHNAVKCRGSIAKPR